MKYTLVSVALVGASFFASAQEAVSEDTYFSKKMSVGIELFSASNEFTGTLAGYSEDIDIDSKGFALQFGFKTGSSKTLTTYFEYRNENFDEGIYDYENNALHYFSIGLFKEFPQENNISPYIRGSLGLGFMEIDETAYTDDTANAFGGKIGAGLAFYPASSIKIYGGVDLQYRIWSPIDTGTYYGDLDIDETSLMFGAGVSYLF
ncbi:hypothetical protein R3X26_15575 [Vibrio sp. TH_r3]|uniref:hypothetical protein n=1 Tax=Vibrio sp. TH_r3 TaxID=3082084 RepID=UPI002954A8C8|nr:hypothetical protein [Vibrio sp. TH_r3]MDV7105824.1 hypothetical protein [Vibrio sp. TH_r3]